MARLLVIVSYKVFPPLMGGQKAVVQFYEHLKKHHVIVMAVSSDNEIADPGYRVESILYNNHRMGQNFLRLLRMIKLIRVHKIDAIIAEHSYTGWMGWLLKKWTGKPFIIHSHNIEALRFRQMGKRGWRWYHSYEKLIHQKADFSFFITKEDCSYAVKEFCLPSRKCSVAPFGANNIRILPSAEHQVRKTYKVRSRYIFYFNGSLDYFPNKEAVERIIDTINPALLNAGIDYTILISGKNLSPHFQQDIKNSVNIRYLDYVGNVQALYQSCTLFINAVTNDSGIKTKLVEALSNGCTVVSTQSGATGVPREICGQKLITTQDGDWAAFVTAMLGNLSHTTTQPPPPFFSYFSWPAIAEKAAGQIQETINHA